MPPKRRVPPGGTKSAPKIELTPEAEEELKKDIEFCVYHFEGLRDRAKKKEDFDKYDGYIQTLGTLSMNTNCADFRIIQSLSPQQ